MTVRVRPRGRVVADRISGTYAFTVWSVATGEELQHGTGKFWGVRIDA